MKRIVILGAGTAGTIMANKLHRSLPADQWEITIVDKDPLHYYQPGFLFLPFGTYAPKDVVRKKAEFIPSRVKFILQEFISIDPAACRITLKDQSTLSYDLLVIASGCDIAPEQTEGLTGDLWRKRIFDFYTFDGAVALEKALRQFDGGKLVVHVIEMPIKCPVAPVEFAFLAHDYFTRRGIRDRVQIQYVTPLPGAFTKERCTQVLGGMFKSRNIEIIAEYNIAHVDSEAKKIVSYDENEIPFDLLVTVPTNMGSQPMGPSKLGDELRFVPTDNHTLRSVKFENIFVIGDATDVPASKAGSVAHFQADILTENILASIAGRPLAGRFDGHANCFIESGFGKAILIDFNYEIEPLTGKFPLPVVGPFDLLRESRINHWGKLAFKWIYWNLLLQGRPMFIGPHMTLTGKDKD